jgi:branched-chain amino acid transport system substrate-binding protein
VLKPAGFEISKGILSTNYVKDATDPTWKDDPGYKQWLAFMDKYYPDGDKTNSFVRVTLPPRPWCRCCSNAATI